MNASSHNLRGAVETQMEAIAENFLQQRRLFNADPGINSLGERIFTLDRYGVPPDVVRALIADVGALLESIDRELGHERTVAGQLDELARVAHRAERAGEGPSALTVKALARTLRPALRTLSTAGAGDPIDFVRAAGTVQRVIATVPAPQLLTGSVRHELGRSPYELLERLVAESDATEAL